MFKKYEWENFSRVVESSYVLPYLFLKEDISENVRLGMLKMHFLRIVATAMYCKGRMPRNREKILEFFNDKFKDKKMAETINKFYGNQYKSINEAVKETVYFWNKLSSWPGLSTSNV